MRERLRTFLGIGTAVAAVGAPFVPTPVVSVPVGDIIAPAVAMGVVRRILHTRSAQVRNRIRPRELTLHESAVLAGVVRSAMTSSSTGVTGGNVSLPDDVHRLLDSVEAPSVREPVPAVSSWQIIVKVMGEPVAESAEGARATFGKKRSIELLSWMVMNRDRLSRVAVRNAMWDFQVADSTFGTVLSDLRRGLARLHPPPSEDGWCPATFTDRLVLAKGIVSDVELLDDALSRGDKDDLVRELSRVRDVPFAGTSFLWADLDGTTTRTVITVMDAVDRLICIGEQDADPAVTMVAVKAGLRVMPGDENLLETQRGLLTR